eukprot:gnl/Spiro4/21318_TR10406_c0_g2_i1.p2 gnl/Spiro4/21318_TR10406_c0_g2~~gnl/Spiro4/21318_TR10406_c0_g2_i1.p2  ORF type:complete len:138 (-),score=31.71 gnl/Spiro4/21318_TR10406_c0_g2_i1:125-538(-)
MGSYATPQTVGRAMPMPPGLFSTAHGQPPQTAPTSDQIAKQLAAPGFSNSAPSGYAFRRDHLLPSPYPYFPPQHQQFDASALLGVVGSAPPANGPTGVISPGISPQSSPHRNNKGGRVQTNRNNNGGRPRGCAPQGV